MSAKRRGLGRGLDVLLGGHDEPVQTEDGSASLRTLPIERLQPGKYQPRTQMDAGRLQELADSIKAQGLIQPIVIRPLGRERYEIVAGERRWRAAQLASLREVPVVVRDIDDRAALAMALIENIQREDLNPLEEANSLKRLIDEFDLTHQQAADAVGRSRASVSNLLRLLELPPGVRALVECKAIEMGHARALLTLPAQQAEALARQAADGNWSVRETERRVQAAQRGTTPVAAPAARRQDADLAALERELSESLGARVAVQHGRSGRGKLVIDYHSLDALDGILARLR
ncbi:MAG: ParB/RepB/Spo0J family partition protein [Lysobacteraceae bacterium]